MDFLKKLVEHTENLRELVYEQYLVGDENLNEMKNKIQEFLVSDLNEKSFSDLYAQTFVYTFFSIKQGLVAAEKRSNKKYATKGLESYKNFLPAGFTREFYFWLLNNSNLQLRDKLQEIFDFIFESEQITENHERGDSLIHFYEDFLAEYSPETRKNLGVWYTPEAIVDYMINFSNDVLINKLNVTDGFLNTEYVEVNDKKYSKVQVLDPATGTGNYILRLTQIICSKITDKEKRIDFVLNHLVDKINAFEISNTSCIFASMQFYQLLFKYGGTKENYKSILDLRPNIYLTNTLDKKQNSLSPTSGFAKLLADENHGANQVKENKPVFVVIGNPPYNGDSKNNSKFITNLMESYKPNFPIGPGLNDDYIKFFRYAHDLINKQETGLVSFITNNSFIKSQACQQMRISLLKDFDEIYILNLNGDKTKEDKNVFDIKANVCITFLIKTGVKDKDDFGQVFYTDLIGSKTFKFESLQNRNIRFKQLILEAPNYFFIPLDNELLKVYNEGFSLGDIFKVKGQSILTAADELVINTKLDKLKENINEYINGATRIELGSTTLSRSKDSNGVYKILPYRVFDNRHYYDSKISVCQRNTLTKHESIEDNYYLGFTPYVRDNNNFKHIVITKNTLELAFFTGKANTHSAPLYIYNEQNKIESNIKESFIKEINDCLGDTEIQAKHIMDYIYGYLNMPSYVEKYNDLLKQNYPRVPYPKDYDEFYKIASIGRELRLLHLFEFETKTSTDIEFPCKINVNKKLEISVNNDIIFQLKNDIWEFKIGACQILKNWIKARADEEITFEEFSHFLKMITAIEETIKLRKKLNEC